MMRVALLFFVLVAPGCSPPQSTTLKYAGIAFDEDEEPTAFAIRVRNISPEPVFLREALPNITFKTVIAEGEAPSEFDFAIRPMNMFGVSLPEGEAYKLPPGKTGELWYEFKWKLPPDPPPMIAIVRASFTVPEMHTPQERVETPPKVFLLQSRDGALDSLLGSTDPSRATETAAALESIEGDRSEQVQAVIDRMRKLAASQDQTDAAAEIAKLLDKLPVGTPAEYERIPAIWEHAIAAGKRNDDAELIRVLELSLPQADAPLADWQAVVLGGGVINGLSQVGVWPQRRLAELMSDRPKLQSRWRRALGLAVAMANNEAVRTGTRYDALRMLGADDYQRQGPELVKFLAQGVDDELHMGAVSGLSDMEAAEVSAALIEAFPRLNDHNRNLAFEALLRTPERKAAMTQAIRDGSISADQLTDEQAAKARSRDEQRGPGERPR